MSKYPYLPLAINDDLADTTDLSVEQHGALLLMLVLAWRRPDCGRPNDMHWLRSSLPNMHGHTVNRLIPPLLARFFDLDEHGVYRNQQLANERQNVSKRSAKAKQSTDKRWGDRRKSNGLADPNAMHSYSYSDSEGEALQASPLCTSEIQSDPESVNNIPTRASRRAGPTRTKYSEAAERETRKRLGLQSPLRDAAPSTPPAPPLARAAVEVEIEIEPIDKEIPF